MPVAGSSNLTLDRYPLASLARRAGQAGVGVGVMKNGGVNGEGPVAADEGGRDLLEFDDGVRRTCSKRARAKICRDLPFWKRS